MRSVYLAGQLRVFEGVVGTSGWTEIANSGSALSPHEDHHSFAFSADGTLAYDGNDGGVWVWNTLARRQPRWLDLNTAGLQSHQVQGVGVNPRNPTWMLVGSNDNGVALSQTGGQPWVTKLGGDGGLVRFGTDGVAYAILALNSNPGGTLQRSPDGRDNWVDIGPVDFDVLRGWPVLATNPGPVLATSPAAARTLLFGGTVRASGTPKVWQTTSGGIGGLFPARWVDLTPLVRPLFPSGEDITALTYAPVAGGRWDTVAYAGFSNGKLFRTNPSQPTPGLVAWVDVTRPGWGANPVRSIAPDPNRPGEVYLAVQAYGPSQVWFSQTSGASWTPIAGNRPPALLTPVDLPNVPVRALVVDPQAGSRVVYAGTEVGVYRGQQAATGFWSWQRLGDNFPNVVVTDLQMIGTLLVAGSEGRGVWTINLGGALGAAIEGRAAMGLALATFTDPAGQGGQSVQSIDWGDGTPLDTTSGTITWSGSTATVKGSHTYAHYGSYTVTITIAKSGSVALVFTAPLLVQDASLSATGSAVSATVNTALNNVQVATFTDANTLSMPSNFTAVISWGDGLVSLGTVSGTSGHFTVTSSHTYLNAGSFAVGVTITEADGPNYALGSSTATASGALSLKPVAISATESSPTGSVTVATFTDTFFGAQPSDYTVTLNWADGHSTTGTVATNPTGGFKITGSNTYAQAGTFPLTISLQNIRGASALLVNPVSVLDASLSGLGMTMAATQGVPLTNVVLARFSDADPNAPLSDYTGTIDWGDEQSIISEGPPVVNPDTVGNVVLEAPGTFAVLGSHTYQQAGTYMITVSLSDAGGSTLTLTGTVTVAGAAPAVTAVSPFFGSTGGGAVVTLTGANLARATAVSFGGVAAAAFVVNADGTVTAVAPAQAGGTVDVTVTTPSATSATGPPDQFTYLAAAPAVTGISPASGSTGGGTSVTITGTNLAGASQVSVGSLPATDFTVSSTTTITATAPAQAAGIVDVTVSGPFGVSATSAADLFTYTAAAPVVTGLDTPAGPTAGGTGVTIYGNNFNGITAVSFGGTAATSFTVLSPTALSATAPAGAAGTVDVTVTTPYGTSAASSADQYTYTTAPTVTAVAPAAGPVGGGTTVAITGTNLSGATQVLFGSVPAAAFTVTSSTAITATASAQAAGTVDVTVTTAGGSSATSASDQYTYQATAPTVTGVAPNRGPTAGGTAVTITGADFTGASQVVFGTTPAAFTVTGDTQIVATAPAGSAGTVDIKVTTPYGTSTATPADQFTFADAAAPAVTGISPATGPMAGGNTVVVSGSGFTAATGVTFGLAAASSFTVVSDTQISATVPGQVAGAVDVTVTTPYGTSSPVPLDGYTYLAAVPSVTSISPNTGTTAGGTQVTITGANLTGATRVAFGAVLAPSFTVNSDTSITATAPVQAVGTVDVTVSTPAGTSPTSPADQYSYTAAPSLPAVTGISPSSGPTGGGTTVTLSGSGFTGATAVVFGTANATAFTVSSDTSLTATAPPQAAGTVDITVTTAAGISSTTSADRYTFTATAPAVTAITPTSGPTSGGTVVTVSGSNFNGATAVKFGMVAATSFTVLSATQITAVAPAQAAGTVDVTVTTPYGTSATSGADRFTYSTVAVPSVTGISPTAGPLAGGSVVTVTGSAFTGATAVSFGSSAAASFAVVSDTQIVAASPTAISGTVHVTVTTLAGTSSTSSANQFTFSASAPTVTGLSPTSGPPAGGTSVTITGTGFTGATAVTFGTAAASFTVNSSTQITATAPAQAMGAVDILVTTPGGTSAPSAADVFTYAAAVPAVTAVSPATGPTGGGTAVAVTGSGFTGATAVQFGATAAPYFTVTSDTALTAYSPPAAAGTVDVTVTTDAGTSVTSGADQFTYQAGAATPAVTGLSPTSGTASGGTTVTITGTNLAGATQVLFGSTPALFFTVNSATSITAVAPSQSTGTVDVTVTTLGGISAIVAADPYTYVATLPTVTGVSPASGATAGGTAVAVSGSGFTGVTQVLFGAVPALSFTIGLDSALIAFAPVSAPGTVDVTVTTPSGTSTTSPADHFTFVAAAGLPSVTGISPASGPTGGGTVATVTGTNFTNVQAVSFGALPADSWLVSTPTSLTATATAQAAGTVDVTVTTPAGTSAASAADHFTYAAAAPAVSGISPTSGPTAGGSTVTITGTNLNGATQVSFGGTAATAFLVNSSTQVTATVPALAAGTYHTTVTTPYGTSATSAADQFTAVAAPTVTGISPTSGPSAGGTSVTITGTSFAGLLTAAFGGQAAATVTVNLATQVTATSPAANPGTVDVTVTTAAGTSATSTADQFTYPVPVPAVTSISPNSGPVAGNNTVTITGSGFTGATAVFFGTVNAPMFHVNSDTQIVVTVPRSTAAGTVDVTVTTPTGTSAAAPADQYTYQ
jgi:hypothetical protein